MADLEHPTPRIPLRAQRLGTHGKPTAPTVEHMERRARKSIERLRTKVSRADLLARGSIDEHAQRVIADRRLRRHLSGD